MKRSGANQNNKTTAETDMSTNVPPTEKTDAEPWKVLKTGTAGTNATKSVATAMTSLTGAAPGGKIPKIRGLVDTTKLRLRTNLTRTRTTTTAADSERSPKGPRQPIRLLTEAVQAPTEGATAATETGTGATAGTEISAADLRTNSWRTKQLLKDIGLEVSAPTAKNYDLLCTAILVTAVVYFVTLVLLIGMATFLDYDPVGRSGVGPGNVDKFVRLILHVLAPGETPDSETEERRRKKIQWNPVRKPETFRGYFTDFELPDLTSSPPPDFQPMDIDDMYQQMLDTCPPFRPSPLFKIKAKNLYSKSGKSVCGKLKPLIDALPPHPNLIRHLASSHHPILYELLISPRSSWNQNDGKEQLDNTYYEGQLNLTIFTEQPTRHIGLHMNSRFIKALVGEASNYRLRSSVMPPVFLLNRCHPSRPIQCPTAVHEYKYESMILLTFEQSLDAGEYYVLMIGPFFGQILSVPEHEDWLLGDDVHDEFRGGLYGDYLIDQPVVQQMRTVFPVRRARNVFPCMDEADRRARFQLRLRHSAEEQAFAAAGASDDPNAVRHIGGLDLVEETVFPTTTVAVAPYQFGFFTENKASSPTSIESYAASTEGGSFSVEVHRQAVHRDNETVYEIGTEEYYLNEVVKKLLSKMPKMTALKKLIILLTDPMGRMGMDSLGIMYMSKRLMRSEDKQFGIRISYETVAEKLIGQLMDRHFVMKSFDEICIPQGYRAITSNHLLKKSGYYKEANILYKMNIFRWKSMDLLDCPLIRYFENEIQTETVCKHKPPLVFAMMELVQKDVVPKLLEHFMNQKEKQRLKKRPSPMMIGLRDWVEAIGNLTDDEYLGKVLETYFIHRGYPIVSVAYGKITGSKREIVLTQLSLSDIEGFGRENLCPQQGFGLEQMPTTITAPVAPAAAPAAVPAVSGRETKYFAVPIRTKTYPIGPRQKNHYWTAILDQKTNYLNTDVAMNPVVKYPVLPRPEYTWDKKADRQFLKELFLSVNPDEDEEGKKKKEKKKENEQVGYPSYISLDGAYEYLKRIQIDNSSAALVLSRNLYTAANYIQMIKCPADGAGIYFGQHPGIVLEIMVKLDKPTILPCLTDTAVRFWVPRVTDDFCFGIRKNLLPLKNDPDSDIESEQWREAIRLVKMALNFINVPPVARECDYLDWHSDHRIRIDNEYR